MSGSVLCMQVSLWSCDYLSVSGCLFLSLTERGPAGARDKSLEGVGSGWGEAGERGGKKNCEKDRTVVLPERRAAGSASRSWGGHSGRHGQSG